MKWTEKQKQEEKKNNWAKGKEGKGIHHEQSIKSNERMWIVGLARIHILNRFLWNIFLFCLIVFWFLTAGPRLLIWKHLLLLKQDTHTHTHIRGFTYEHLTSPHSRAEQSRAEVSRSLMSQVNLSQRSSYSSTYSSTYSMVSITENERKPVQWGSSPLSL